MKTAFFPCLLAFFSLAVSAFAAPGASTPAPPDPIVGKWFWRYNESVVFKADGTCSGENGNYGSWEYLKNPEAGRKYRVVWEDGKIINKVVCTEDGQRAYVQNQRNEHFEARRAIIPEVKKIPADPHDPLLGRWDWYGGSSTTFDVDGSCDNNGVQGVWSRVSKDEAGSKYRFVWSNGKYVDEAVISGDGKTLHIRNNHGANFEVHRTASN